MTKEGIKEPRSIKKWLGLIVGAVLAYLVTIGIWRIVRTIIFLGLFIYGFFLVVQIGSPLGPFSFLEKNLWNISKLFSVAVIIYLLFVKKKSSEAN